MCAISQEIFLPTLHCRAPKSRRTRKKLRLSRSRARERVPPNPQQLPRVIFVLLRCRKFSRDSFYYVYDSEQPIPLSASGVSSNGSNSLARSATSTADSNSSLMRRANAIGAAIPIRGVSHLHNIRLLSFIPFSIFLKIARPIPSLDYVS